MACHEGKQMMREAFDGLERTSRYM